MYQICKVLMNLRQNRQNQNNDKYKFSGKLNEIKVDTKILHKSDQINS